MILGLILALDRRIPDNVIDLREDGSFKMNQSYFNYLSGLTMTNGRFDESYGEFVLPYEQVRTSTDPEQELMAFLESTYAAVADCGDWPRTSLEVPLGAFGKPYDVEARRKG